MDMRDHHHATDTQVLGITMDIRREARFHLDITPADIMRLLPM
jgi:hypothetical protein